MKVVPSFCNPRWRHAVVCQGNLLTTSEVELTVSVVERKLAQHKQKWLTHVSRMEDRQNSSLTIDLSEDDLYVS